MFRIVMIFTFYPTFYSYSSYLKNIFVYMKISVIKYMLNKKYVYLPNDYV